MKMREARQQIVASAGAWGTHWGINRTMAQYHAVLLVRDEENQFPGICMKRFK